MPCLINNIFIKAWLYIYDIICDVDFDTSTRDFTI